MSNEEIIDYGKLVDDAMHIIVYNALKHVEKKGLPGHHHFFISFLTRYKGVILPTHLIEKYPKEMTIVLQYQFDDLIVEKEGFGVVLSFSNHKEKLYIPFAAITTFADPSVQFGLQFREIEEIRGDEQFGNSHSNGSDDEPTPPPTNASPSAGNSNVISLDSFRKK